MAVRHAIAHLAPSGARLLIVVHVDEIDGSALWSLWGPEVLCTDPVLPRDLIGRGAGDTHEAAAAEARRFADELDGIVMAIAAPLLGPIPESTPLG